MKLWFVFILIISFPITVWSQNFNSLSVEFTRTIERNNKKEVVCGKIYHTNPKTILKVTKPITQWIIKEEKNISLYYPDEKRAIEIKSENPTFLNFFEAFLNANKEDYGLSASGYSIEKSEIKGDTLFSCWNPPENLSKSLGQFILAYKNDKIVVIKNNDVKGSYRIKVTFKNHILNGAAYYPLEITMEQYIKNKFSVEKIVFSNLEINKPFPKEISNFQIPREIKLDTIKW